MKEDRFEIGFTINEEINDSFDIQALNKADKMATDADSDGKKGAIFCQVYVRGTDNKASINGRFICYEAALEIGEIFKKYGYPCDTKP